MGGGAWLELAKVKTMQDACKFCKADAHTALWFAQRATTATATAHSNGENGGNGESGSDDTAIARVTWTASDQHATLEHVDPRARRPTVAHRYQPGANCDESFKHDSRWCGLARLRMSGCGDCHGVGSVVTALDFRS